MWMRILLTTDLRKLLNFMSIPGTEKNNTNMVYWRWLNTSASSIMNFFQQSRTLVCLEIAIANACKTKEHSNKNKEMVNISIFKMLCLLITKRLQKKVSTRNTRIKLSHWVHFILRFNSRSAAIDTFSLRICFVLKLIRHIPLTASIELLLIHSGPLTRTKKWTKRKKLTKLWKKE